MSSNEKSEVVEQENVILGFALSPLQRVVCAFVGLALGAFAVIFSFTDGANVIGAIALAGGILLFVLALIGRFGGIKFSTAGGTHISIEPPPQRTHTSPESTDQRGVAEQPSPVPLNRMSQPL